MPCSERENKEQLGKFGEWEKQHYPVCTLESPVCVLESFKKSIQWFKSS